MAAPIVSFLPEVPATARGGDLRECLRSAAQVVGASAVALTQRSADGFPRVMGWWSTAEESEGGRRSRSPSGRWREPTWVRPVGAAADEPREEWTEIALTDFGSSLWLAGDPREPRWEDDEALLVRQLGEQALAAAVLRGDFRAGPVPVGPARAALVADGGFVERFSAGHELLLRREREERRKAEEAVLARDDFLAMVSHDLRNPLNVVDLTLRSLAGAEPPLVETPGPVQRQLEVAVHAADRMKRMLRDLLDTAQIERGSLAVRPVRCDLRTVLRDAEESTRHLAERERIRVEVEVTAGLPHVWADPERILQALVNLLQNALQNSPAESTVRLRADRADGIVRIAVSDQGPGIPADDRPRVFDRFWRGRSGRGAGVGLGLAIVKGIVESHGGRVWVDTREGRGSTFFLTLRPALGRSPERPAGSNRPRRRGELVP